MATWKNLIKLNCSKANFTPAVCSSVLGLTHHMLKSQWDEDEPRGHAQYMDGKEADDGGDLFAVFSVLKGIDILDRGYVCMGCMDQVKKYG